MAKSLDLCLRLPCHQPGTCEGPSPGEDRVRLELPDRTPTPSVVGSGLGGPSDEQETLHVEPIEVPSQPPVPPGAEHTIPDADVREYAPSPTPSEHGSDTSRLHSPVINQPICNDTRPSSPVANQTAHNGPQPSSPGSSGSSASFSERCVCSSPVAMDLTSQQRDVGRELNCVCLGRRGPRVREGEPGGLGRDECTGTAAAVAIRVVARVVGHVCGGTRDESKHDRDWDVPSALPDLSPGSL